MRMRVGRCTRVSGAWLVEAESARAFAGAGSVVVSVKEIEIEFGRLEWMQMQHLERWMMMMKC